MPEPRILIVDSQPIFSAGLRVVLESEFDTVHAVSEDSELGKKVSECGADIVLVDHRSLEQNGTDLIADLKESHPATGVIVVSAEAGARVVETVFRAGADGYLITNCSTSELLAAIRGVAEGRKYVSPAVARGFLDRFISRTSEGPDSKVLTPRRREVLQLIAEGCSTKQIAEVLHIAPKTVESHRYALMKGLDLHSTADLTRYALRHGIVSDD